MKKLIVALFAAVLASAGLVVATGGTASAGCTPSQYSGCVRTETKAQVPDVVGKNKRARICARVDAVGSNAKPEGRIVFKIKRKKGGYYEKQAVAYAGGKTCITTRVLTRTGKYLVTAKYQSEKGSVFSNSTGSNDFRVKR